MCFILLSFYSRVSERTSWEKYRIFAYTCKYIPQILVVHRYTRTQPVLTLFLFKSIWTCSQGSQGCHKIRFNFSKMKVFTFCAKIAPERHKLRKTIKIGKTCQKTPVFLDLFEYSSIWGQY